MTIKYNVEFDEAIYNKLNFEIKDNGEVPIYAAEEIEIKPHTDTMVNLGFSVDYPQEYSAMILYTNDLKGGTFFPSLCECEKDDHGYLIAWVKNTSDKIAVLEKGTYLGRLVLFNEKEEPLQNIIFVPTGAKSKEIEKRRKEYKQLLDSVANFYDKYLKEYDEKQKKTTETATLNELMKFLFS